MKKKCSTQRRDWKKRTDAAENDVHAVFQLWGDFPACGPTFCCETDWIHVLLSNLTDVTEQARLLQEPEHDEAGTRRGLRRHLATLAKACEMWDAELAKEEGKK